MGRQQLYNFDMTIDEAEKITADFGEFYANRRGSLAVLEDETTAESYLDIGGIPYLSIWDLPYSPARIKYAILFRAEHAVKHGYMDFIPPGDEREKYISATPIGNWLQRGYGFLGGFVEDAYEINKKRLEIQSIQDIQKQKVAIIKFEAKYKTRFFGPYSPELEVEFQNFLADLHNNWRQ